MDNIFIETTVNDNITVKPKYLNKNLNTTILKMLKDKYEGKCFINYGYFKKNSIEILNRNLGYINRRNLIGNIIYSVNFKATICNPVEGNIIECQVKNINKLGLASSIDDILMDIIVPKDLHEDLSVFENIKVDDMIKIKVIGKNISENNLIVLGKIATEEEYKELKINKKTIKHKKQDSDFINEINTNLDDAAKHTRSTRVKIKSSKLTVKL